MQRIKYEADNTKHFSPIEADLRRAITRLAVRDRGLFTNDWTAQIQIKDDNNNTFFQAVYGENDSISREAIGKINLLSLPRVSCTGVNDRITTYNLCEIILDKDDFGISETSGDLIQQLLSADMVYELGESAYQKILKEYGYYFRDGGIKISCKMINASGATEKRIIQIVFHGCFATQFNTYYALEIFRLLQQILARHEEGNSYEYDLEPLRKNNTADLFIRKTGIAEA